MSNIKFHTPRFVKMANVSLGNRFNPIVTGKPELDGQIDSDNQQYVDLVLDKERERSHYFDGKLLKAQDLLRDQNYLDARLRQAGRAFGGGIIEGLDARLDQGRVIVRPGSGITPSGLVLELRDHNLSAPVNNAALRKALNQGRHAYLNSGLYMVLLSWHEETSEEIAEVYPRKVSVQPQPRPDAYQQGVRLELMPLQQGTHISDELMARAELADEFLRHGAEFPGMPADSLPLALLAVRNNLPLWLDSSLVRRDYRNERQQHAARLRHRRQYADLLDDVVQRQGPQGFELNRYFHRIPAMGPLPKGFVDPAQQTFTGFPDHYQLSLVPVRADDIAFLMAQTEHLPPLDLRHGKSESVQVLVPLGEDDYEKLVAGLQDQKQPAVAELTVARVREFSVAKFKANAYPFERMIATRIKPRLLARQSKQLQPAWVSAFGKIADPTGLYYMREFQLSAIQAPEVLPIARGFPQAQQPVGGETPPADPTPVEPSPVDPPPPEPSIVEIVKARGSKDEKTLMLMENQKETIEKFQGHLQQLFKFMDNAYDRLFWRALFQVPEKERFLEELLKFGERGLPVEQVILKMGQDLGLLDEELKLWEQLTKFYAEMGDVVR